ncbi:MAG: hypothetical protein ABI210_15275, partial [Abditibacteriaceae bacterium]
MKLFWMIGLALMTSVASAQTSPNLIANPRMEETTPQGFAANWIGGEFGKAGANIALDSVAHSGNVSVRLGVVAGSFVTCASSDIKVKPNTPYYISWWCKTKDFEQARAYVFLQTNKAQRVLPEADQYGTSEWTQHFGRYVTASDETTLHPVLTTQDMGGKHGFAWFDDVGVYESTFPTDLKVPYERWHRNLEGISETAVVLSESAALSIWSDNLEARIYHDGGVPDYAKPASSVNFSGARGEQTYAQIAILPKDALSQLQLASADLKGPSIIAAAHVQWWPIGFTHIITATDPQVRTGPTPDPILATAPVNAKAGENCPFLISVTIPRDAKAGTYRGAIAVRAGDRQIASIPLSVQVFNFALPVNPVFRTLITYTPDSMSPWDKRPVIDIEHDIARVLYANGIRGSGQTTEVPAKIVDG